ncbi:MAG: DUF2867 domain-containing protein [Anaerolineae bacterium]|nr:MAG: DUF2867 domain-containing protein [Anaerolineae bacterium]
MPETPSPAPVLVTGATGYLASRLIPLLLEKGYPVRCLARQPERLRARRWFSRVEVTAGDVTRAETLPAAMQGIHSAYYLIHSMAAGHGYEQLDLQAARNFATAARNAGVEHIIYVGGLADPTDPHLALHLKSRIETGDALREAGVPVTEFRAGVIVGPGSVSFEMIRFIAEQFPLMIGPRWLRHRSQPIATPDILAYLVSALETPACRGKIIEIGCEREHTYIELMTEYARIRHLWRRSLLLPFIPPVLMAFFIDKLTPVHYSYALPLVEGLQNDSLVKDRLLLELFPTIKPLDYAEAVRQALQDTHPDQVERIWLDMEPEQKFLLHEGLFIDYRRLSDPMHRLPKPPLRLPFGIHLRHIEQQSEHVVRLKAEPNRWGTLWLEWQVVTPTAPARVEQTLFFMPNGLPGALFGYVALPYAAKYAAKTINANHPNRA